MIKDPLNKGQFLRVNGRYDNQEVIVENALRQEKQFKDLPKVSQLTQNSWNMSPYTREDVYKDIVVKTPRIIGRLERTKGLLDPLKYHEHRWI